MRPRRVAYVVGVFPKLSETFVANELAEVRRRGVEVRVLSLRRPTETLRHPVVLEAGLEACAVYEEEKFAEVLREFRPDLLHAHFATRPTGVARELAAELGVPFTFTAHRYDIFDKPPEDFAARAAAARLFVTVSEANVHHLTGTFGVPAERMRVIPCGVDTERFCPALAEQPKTPLIVCVARLVKVKNQTLLLQTCAQLRDRGLTFRCVVVGDGPMRGELETLAKQLRLDGWVEFAGAADQNQVLGWWQRAAIAVLTSDSEGMPVCLMEAAACALPVVATSVGGVPELVREGETGFLAPPGNATALADALEKLLRDETLRSRFGLAARRVAETQLSLARQVDQLLALWSEILEGPKSL
ncbi:MAG: glycosyltransferase family 4 protein [Verrucomicrobiota bacterium]